MRYSTALPIAATVSLAVAQSGDFTALAYNVAGLPAFLNDNGVPGDKETNAKTIGSKFASLGYDIIQMQEDFNYHAAIYSTDNHPYRTPTSGGAGFGDGLNTVSNFPFTGLTRTKWKDCNGVFDAGNDCLTPKGFTFTRIQIAPGVEVDSYNVHHDAGSADNDRKARRGNTLQLIAAINANSAGRAVLVFGDTNSRYTTADDNIRELTNQAGLVDPWVQLIKGGVPPAAGSPAIPCGNPAESVECEIVDKLFYRSGDTVSLTATGFSYATPLFLQPDGNILSDHNPVLVNFAYSVKASTAEQGRGSLE